jgi:hypothetical protein
MLVVEMDTALFGDEPLIVLLLIGFYLSILLSSEVLHRVAPLCAIGAILLQMCHRLLATLWQMLQGLRGYWQPSGKFVIGYQRLLATFANSTYLQEGCQHPLIFGQRVLITLQSNCQMVLDNLYCHL